DQRHQAGPSRGNAVARQRAGARLATIGPMAFSPFFRMALVLGLLSAIGPFAIDMYLPALPAIGASLSADVGAVQWSLTAFFLALGVGQLAYGPVSDMA